MALHSQPTGIARLLARPRLPSMQVRDVLARIHDEQVEAVLVERRLLPEHLTYTLTGVR